MGFRKVETLIASGNVIFDWPSKSQKALERKIEDYLRDCLGYEVATFIRSIPELAKTAGYQPFAEAEMNQEGNVVYVGFLTDAPGIESKLNLLSLRTKVDDFHVHGREVYWLRRTKMGESRFSMP